MTTISFPFRNGLFLALSFVVLTFFSCTSTQHDSENTDENDDENTAEVIDFNNEENIIYSVPTPLEIAVAIKNAGVPFNREVLHNTDKAASYISSSEKALNLGIYSVDLSFASLYEQPQLATDYIATAKQLADDLGITNDVDKDIIEKFEANINDREYILNLISELLMNAIANLSNEQKVTGAHIMAGGWIEGLYVLTQFVDATGNNTELLVERVAEQKLTLGTLISFLKQLKDENVADLLEKLTELQAIYAKIEISNTELIPVIDTLTNETILESDTKISVSLDVLNEICIKVKNIRNSYTQ